MSFSKIIHRVCERRTTIIVLNTLWLAALHYSKRFLFQNETVNCVITGFAIFTVAVFLLTGLFLPIAGILEIRKHRESSKEEVMLFLQFVIVPPLMAFDAVLCGWELL